MWAFTNEYYMKKSRPIQAWYFICIEVGLFMYESMREGKRQDREKNR